MIKLDLQSRIPIYEQLKNQIGQLVLAGELKADDQLPSVRQFARDLGINPNTVQKAYQDLERDGLIYSVSGRGNYINPDPDLRARLINEQVSDFRLAVNKAKASGIDKKTATGIVTEVYSEEENNDIS